VILLPVPFSDLSSHNVRPAVVVGSEPRHGDLFIVPITSQLANADVPLADWQLAGLYVACGIKAQFATVEARLVRRKIGRLTQRDRHVLDERIREWLRL